MGREERKSTWNLGKRFCVWKVKRMLVYKGKAMGTYSWLTYALSNKRHQIYINRGLKHKVIDIRSSHKFVPTFVYTFHVSIYKHTFINMYLKNGKKLHNERGITFFHETERYVNNLNIYNRLKNGTNLWDDLIYLMHKCHSVVILSSFITIHLKSSCLLDFL